MAGLYAENVEDLSLQAVSIAFNNQEYQDYWGSACVNTTAAGFPVSQSSVQCVPPGRMRAAGGH